MKNKTFVATVYMQRESDLKRKWAKGGKNITPLQRTWTRYMLSIWGEKVGGKVSAERGCENVIGRLMIRTDWDDRSGKRIIEVVSNLHKQGYSGNELFQKAREIVMPGTKFNNLLTLAKESEDADFVESVMLEAFSLDNPIRYVAIKHYCERKITQELSVELCKATQCDISTANRRVRWCHNQLEEVMFNAMMKRDGEIILQNAA